MKKAKKRPLFKLITKIDFYIEETEMMEEELEDYYRRLGVTRVSLEKGEKNAT